MSDDCTPTTEDQAQAKKDYVHETYIMGAQSCCSTCKGHAQETWDKWLAGVKAEAWEQGAKTALFSEGYDTVEHAKVLESNPHRKEANHEHN